MGHTMSSMEIREQNLFAIARDSTIKGAAQFEEKVICSCSVWNVAVYELTRLCLSLTLSRNLSLSSIGFT
jgi:hypothetical protein